MMPIGKFLADHASVFAVKLLEHIYLAVSATVIAILIGVPLGILILRQNKLKSIILGITGVFQTIPSLALLAFLIPFLGIGIKPTVVTLTVYALLPITRNTYAGLCRVPSESIEAARALGFTRWQRLWLIELPLALPIIVAGIRTATAITIGITTIAAFIGAGGLGDFIIQGLSLDNSRLILLGAIPAALLALALDFIIGNIETSLSHRKRRRLKYKKTKMAFLFSILTALFFLVSKVIIWPASADRKVSIVIATKNFSEQFVLGDLLADMIEAKTHLKVIKKFNLGTTDIIQHALQRDEVDLYPEYTGTAYLVILKQKKIMTSEKTYQFVKRAYQRQFHLIWLTPFGFDNSQTLAVLKPFAEKNHLTTMSDLAKISAQFTVAAPAEFLLRPDALPGLTHAYGFKFKKIIQMEPDLMYQAIKNKDVDVTEVFTTDGRISAYHLVALKDNKHFYPPYYAAPVIREAVLNAHPEIMKALMPLAGLINDQTMQSLNYLVSVKKETPEKVAHDFLVEKGLL